ncbi:hypothetical protein WH52_04840 [Tenacibaculum holothuriorum]|uniref:OmpA-like domain-containing protein n=1 Tax=Tenacibaculum holothuriorum TaxID=1635173 RepID=A0A1Y2PG53_9FLAO|nr:OmpA family protein [Tenacibaculum holothuriorum]OSY88991.1 hypothetical protein WH52_04840 [Tenacibaculum holothuriorum]
MSKKASYLLGIILTILVGTFLYYKFCCSQCHKEKEHEKSLVVEEEVTEIKNPTTFPFSFKDTNGDLSFSVDESFNFNKSDYKILDSISSNIDDGVFKIKEYLDANGNKRFNITGFYTSDEVNNSAFPNLGLARANSVKNYMVSKGIPSKMMNIYGALNDELVADENNIFLGPFSFEVFTRTEESTAADKALKVACEALKENPLMLNFKTGAASINLTSEQRQKFADIMQCIDKLGATVNVVGHTDNTGNPESNMQLGLKRANFVKGYLVQNGILSNSIETSSKGQTTPIADNKTPEGRAKNRRIEVTIN